MTFKTIFGLISDRKSRIKNEVKIMQILANYPLYTEQDKAHMKDGIFNFVEDENCHELRCAEHGCPVCLRKRKEMMEKYVRHKQIGNRVLTLGDFYYVPGKQDILEKLRNGEKISLGV